MLVYLLYFVVPALAQLTSSDKIDILNTFNAARCSLTTPPPVLMPSMYWDLSLEALAQEYVNLCPSESASVTCVESGGSLAGDSRCTNFSLYGNLYSGVANFSDYTPARLVKFWTDLKPFWTYGVFGGNASGVQKCTLDTCAPYTQIVQAATFRVGCALNSIACTGMCAAPQKCCNLNISANGCDMCRAQLACFFDPKGDVVGEAPYQAGVLASVNPPQACQSVNSTDLDILPPNGCALALTKGLNTTCGNKVNATQTCVIICGHGYVPTVQNITNVSVSCGLGVLSPPIESLSNFCKKFVATSGALRISSQLATLAALLSFLY